MSWHRRDYISSTSYKTTNGVTLRKFNNDCTKYWLDSIEDSEYVYNFHPTFHNGKCIRGTVLEFSVYKDKFFKFERCSTFHPVEHWVPFMPKSLRLAMNNKYAREAKNQSNRVVNLMPSYILMLDVNLIYKGEP